MKQFKLVKFITVIIQCYPKIIAWLLIFYFFFSLVLGEYSNVPRQEATYYSINELPEKNWFGEVRFKIYILLIDYHSKCSEFWDKELFLLFLNIFSVEITIAVYSYLTIFLIRTHFVWACLFGGKSFFEVLRRFRRII